MKDDVIDLVLNDREKIKRLESENARLKALLQDAQELIHAPTGDPFEYKLKYDSFQVKLKREGI
jgi:hypothetical protein